MNINVGNNFLNIRKFQGSYGDFFIVKYIIYFYIIIYCEKNFRNAADNHITLLVNN